METEASGNPEGGGHMLRTRFTEMLGIKHPMMMAGMNWITTPKLVAAVCNATGTEYFRHGCLYSRRDPKEHPGDSETHR